MWFLWTQLEETDLVPNLGACSSEKIPTEMDSIIVQGGKCLQGEVSISGSKNAALPLMAATLLAEGRSVLRNIPQLRDIHNLSSLLQQLGCKVERSSDQLAVTTPSKIALLSPAFYDTAKTIRASILLLGPLVTRYRRAEVSQPGGCAIGDRPIDQHLMAFASLGAQIIQLDGYIKASAKQRLTGTKIIFDMPTVSGTQNIMMAAVLAEGETILENVACHPEVVELASFLNTMGAKIEGAGTRVIHIQGVDKLHSTTYRIIPDRIEAGTYAVAAAVTGGDLLLKNVELSHLDTVLDTLKLANVEVANENGSLRVRSKGSIHPFDITTQAYPGFPTDLQAQFMVLATCVDGESTIRECIFENRFKHVPELNRMGASITTKGQTATIRGNAKLSGTSVMATDLRAGAALVLAGLAASGTTMVRCAHHIDRGYEQLEYKLTKVGAIIQRE